MTISRISMPPLKADALAPVPTDPGTESDETGTAQMLRSIPEQIAADIGTAIIAGKHPVGQRLIEAEVATHFGVSRGPIREALRILERRRLVDLLPRRGAYVREVSLNSIADVFNTRIALSTMAVRVVALVRPASYVETLRRRVDELNTRVQADDAVAGEFARIVARAVSAIARGSGNSILIDALSDIAQQTVWTTIWSAPLDYLSIERRADTARAMAAVLAAIERGDALVADAELRDLLESDRDESIRHLSVSRGGICDPVRLLRTRAN